MLNFELEVFGSDARITFPGAAADIELLAARTHEVLPLLVALVRSDQARTKLTDVETAERGKAILAIDLKVQVVLHSALKNAELLNEIIEGLQLIEDHGFPEFGLGRNIDV